MEEERLLYSIAEACRALGVGRTTLYKMTVDGRLVTRKLGRRTVIMATDLHACLENLPLRSRQTDG